MARILHLISQLEEGGAQKQLSYMIEKSRSHEMEIAALIASPSENMLPAFRDSRVPIHFLSNSADFYAPEIVPALKRLLDQGNYSLVHCWLFQSIVQGVILARLKGIPVIASPRSMRSILDLNFNKRWEQRLIRKAHQLADLVLFPSNTVAIDFIDAGWVRSSRARVVQNGVDVEHFGKTEGGDAILNIGRLSNEKAYEDLKPIFMRLRQEIPEARFVIAGGGNAPHWDGVEFSGFLADVREVLRQSAIYISTSRVEGLSNALLEAQAMGIPAVVRNAGFNSELIEQGVNGYLASSIDEFVHACLLIWKNPGLRTRMGENARQKISAGFNIANQVAKIESIYHELL
jgi:glycosyltransferase involved in cell wall biosynthesis